MSSHALARKDSFKDRNWARENQRLEARRSAFADRQARYRHEIIEQLRLLSSGNTTRGHKSQVEYAEDVYGEEDGNENEDEIEQGAGAADIEAEPIEVDETSSKRGKHAAKSKRKKLHRPRRFFSPLMLWEWMIDIPSNLANDWYVRPRPDGKRVTVMIRNSKVYIHNKNGNLVQRPFVDMRWKDHHEKTVLDCVMPYEEQSQADVCFVLDAMVWNGFSLHECTSELRFHWLQTHLTECFQAGTDHELAYGEVDKNETPSRMEMTTQSKPKKHKPTVYQYCLVPFYSACKENIQKCYEYTDQAFACDSGLTLCDESFVAWHQDGLLFYRLDSLYTPGSSPLALQWKDMKCSPYYVETIPEPPPEHIPIHDLPLIVSLLVDKDFQLKTADDPPVVVLSHVDQVLYDEQVGLKPGELANLEVIHCEQLLQLHHATMGDTDDDNNNNVYDDNDQQAQIQLKFHSIASKARRVPDLYSRIVFQCCVRCSPIGIDMLLD